MSLTPLQLSTLVDAALWTLIAGLVSSCVSESMRHSRRLRMQRRYRQTPLHVKWSKMRRHM